MRLVQLQRQPSHLCSLPCRLLPRLCGRDTALQAANLRLRLRRGVGRLGLHCSHLLLQMRLVIARRGQAAFGFPQRLGRPLKLAL